MMTGIGNAVLDGRDKTCVHADDDTNGRGAKACNGCGESFPERVPVSCRGDIGDLARGGGYFGSDG